MRYCGWALLVALLWALPAAGAGDLVERFRNASKMEREAMVTPENAADFAAQVQTALAAMDPAAPDPLFEEAASAYLRATGDSLLVADVVFVLTAVPDRREAWVRGITSVNEGGARQAEKDYPGAIHAYGAAIASFTAAEHARRVAVTWGTLGTAWNSAGYPDSARTSYETALVFRRQLGDPLLVAPALDTLGRLATQRGEYRAALGYLEEAHRLREALGDPSELATSLIRLGDVHWQLGNLESARTSYDRVLDVVGRQETSGSALDARNGLANVLEKLGEYREAAEIYRRLLEPAEASGDLVRVAVLHRNLAGVLLRMGDPSRSLRELRLAQNANEQEENLHELAGTLDRTGEVLAAIGDDEGALSTWQRAIQLADSSGNVATANHARLNLAHAFIEAGFGDRAREIYEGLYQSSEGNTVVRALVVGDLGILEGREGNHERGLEHHRQSLALHEAAGRVEGVLESRINVGVELTALGRLEEGRTVLEEAADQAESLAFREVLGAIYLHIADNADQAGDLERAREYNGRVIDLVESFRSADPSEATRAAALGASIPAYEAQIHVLARLAEKRVDPSLTREAFGVAERGKAQAFLGTLGETRLGLSPQLPLEQETRLKVLERGIRGTRYRLRLLETGSAPADTLRALRQRLEELELAYEDIRQGGRYEDPRFAALDPGEPATIEDVQEHLLADSDAALVEYVLGDTASYVWAITPNTVAFRRLAPKASIDAMVQELRASLDREAGALRGRRPGAAEVAGSDCARAAAALGQAVLAPILADLGSARRIHVVADGSLHFIPFELLLGDAAVDPATPGAWPYALRDAVVSYGPSATSLLYLAEWRAQREAGGEGFIGVGDPAFASTGGALLVARVPGDSRAGLQPLPFTRVEVERIGALFEEKDRVLLLGTEAAERTLADPGFLSRFRYIHLATHGVADERRPVQSRIVLAYPSDESEDGYLQASEVYGLRLQADLVVLSAGETGRGKMIQGEGVMGLPRAFLYAGTPAVVVSLWNVSDEATADLMTAFYEAMIRDGLSAAEALSRAKKTLRGSARWAHPYYWAAFVLVGMG